MIQIPLLSIMRANWSSLIFPVSSTSIHLSYYSICSVHLFLLSYIFLWGPSWVCLFFLFHFRLLPQPAACHWIRLWNTTHHCWTLYWASNVQPISHRWWLLYLKLPPSILNLCGLSRVCIPSSPLLIVKLSCHCYLIAYVVSVSQWFFC